MEWSRAKGWGLLGAMTAMVLLGQVAGYRAYRAHTDLLWGRCLDNGAVPAWVWVVAAVTPVLNLAAVPVAVLVFRRCGERQVLLVAVATLVIGIAGVLGLLDVYVFVSMVTDGHDRGGDTCGL
ncbi:hypothetical protein ACIRPK_36470 [Kitasatospora sp. NPDC101801]|uniref:hypothetical protein n=1 Tax=Kitasatospora sp. NPDC101801 TaxID=3364103 RepID=UPI0038219E43